MEIPDGNLKHRTVDVDVDGTEVRLRISTGGRPHSPGILLIHEKRGVDVHTQHIADHLAAAGYTVFVPDLLSRYGRSRHGAVPTARGIPRSWHVDDLVAVCDRVAGWYDFPAMGCLGYSFGGELATQLAAQYSPLQALVTYYAHPVDRDWRRLQIPVLAIYADTDEQLDRVGEARGALSDDRSPVLVQSFPGPRGFEDPHRPERYREESARAAWQLTVDWFREHLTGRTNTDEQGEGRA